METYSRFYTKIAATLKAATKKNNWHSSSSLEHDYYILNPKEALINFFDELCIPNMDFAVEISEMELEQMERQQISHIDVLFKSPKYSFIFKFNFFFDGWNAHYEGGQFSNFWEGIVNIASVYLPNYTTFNHSIGSAESFIIIANTMELNQYISDNNNDIFFSTKAILEPLCNTLHIRCIAINFLEFVSLPQWHNIEKCMLIELRNKFPSLSNLDNLIKILWSSNSKSEPHISAILLSGVKHNCSSSCSAWDKELIFLQPRLIDIMLVLAILKQDDDDIVGLEIKPIEQFSFQSKEEAIALLDDLVAKELAKFWTH